MIKNIFDKKVLNLIILFFGILLLMPQSVDAESTECMRKSGRVIGSGGVSGQTTGGMRVCIQGVTPSEYEGKEEFVTEYVPSQGDVDFFNIYEYCKFYSDNHCQDEADPEGYYGSSEVVTCFCYKNSDPSNRVAGKAICNSGLKKDRDTFCDAQKGGYDECLPSGSTEECKIELAKWNAKNSLSDLASTESSFIPNCALYDVLTPECRNISIFVTMLINVGRYLFAVVGALVLLMLVIGGFQLIISEGNPEKVKKAKDIMVGAVLGLVVVFGAYMLVDFLAEMIELDTNLRL